MNKQRLLDRFLRYINCPSESGSERSFCELIEQELSALGLEVKRGEVGEKCGSNGFNLYAFLPGDGEPLLLSAHLDTVSPGVGIRPVIEDGVIRSSGDTILGADDKSGVAAILEALETLHEGGLAHRPVEVLFSICEELGLLGAKYADYSLFAANRRLFSTQAQTVRSSTVRQPMWFCILLSKARAPMRASPLNREFMRSRLRLRRFHTFPAGMWMS